ncbi:MAG: hypothetical protein AAAC47_13630, partial [Pararhizobium sp.]
TSSIGLRRLSKLDQGADPSSESTLQQVRKLLGQKNQRAESRPCLRQAGGSRVHEGRKPPWDKAEKRNVMTAIARAATLSGECVDL